MAFGDGRETMEMKYKGKHRKEDTAKTEVSQNTRSL